MKEKRILVTGRSGFIGENLWKEWEDRYDLVPVSFSASDPAAIEILPGDVVIHLAGIAHQKKGTDPKLYYDVNYLKAVSFAKQAKLKGATQFIYISTTKVYGKDSGVISEATPCLPVDDYGKSKLLAENEIMAMASDEFIVSIVRPPLVYGPGVKGNMLSLLKWTAAGRPLPFKGVDNQRTVVNVFNLIAMLDTIIEKKQGGIFIPADDQPLSTFEMFRLIKSSLGTANTEIRVPAIFVKLVSAVFPGKGAKIFGSLLYDNSSTKRQLNFSNPFNAGQGFEQMTAWFKQNNN